MEIKPCEWCKKEFRAGPRKNGVARFCSIACSYAHRMSNRVTKSCSFCGRSYTVSPLRATVSICCSKSCYKKLVWSIDVICSQCGSHFRRRKDSSALHGGSPSICRKCVSSKKDRACRPQKTGGDITCPICGNSFHVPACQLETRKWCSRKCTDIARRAASTLSIKRTCKHCGIIYRRQVQPGRTSNFCSNECKGSWASKQFRTYVCQVCGNPYESATISKSTTKYCSNRCSQRSRGGRRKNGYRDTMKQAGRLECCEICGWREHPEVLQVDHKDGVPWNNERSNLQVLCPNCHAWETYQRREAKRKANLAKPSH